MVFSPSLVLEKDLRYLTFLWHQYSVFHFFSSTSASFPVLSEIQLAPTARYVITLLLEDTDGKEDQITSLNITLTDKPNLFSRYRLAIA